MSLRVVFAALCLVSVACGPKLPPRYVIEKDLDPYGYRRYQQVLDVEFPIPGNPAVAHTATYVLGGSSVRVAPVVVTAYEHPASLTETVRQRLRAMDGYTFDVYEVEGEPVWRMRGESGDLWLVWVSGPHLVKLGAPEGESDVPAPIAEAYLAQYAPDLDKEGHAKTGSLSAGPALEADSAAAGGAP